MSFKATPGVGASFAADQVGNASPPATNELLSYCKLDIGAAGASAPVTATGPNLLPVSGGPAAVVQVTPAVTAGSIYANGKGVGGIQTVGLLRLSNGAVILESITVFDKANQQAPLTIYFFSASPGGTCSDHNTFAPNNADGLKFLGAVSVPASAYVAFGSGKCVATVNAIALVLQGAASNVNVYAVAVTSGTPTYAATDDVTFAYGVLQV
jgi:hypothetical protein